MVEKEHSRVRSLLIGVAFIYIFDLILAYWVVRSDIYYFGPESTTEWILFIFIASLLWLWFPISIFLLFQGIRLKRIYTRQNYSGDRTIANLAITFPLVFAGIWIASRTLSY